MAWTRAEPNIIKSKIDLIPIFAIILILIIISGIISLLIPLVLEQGKNLSLLNVNAFQEKANTLYSEFGVYLNKYNMTAIEVSVGQVLHAMNILGQVWSENNDAQDLN